MIVRTVGNVLVFAFVAALIYTLFPVGREAEIAVWHVIRSVWHQFPAAWHQLRTIR